MSLPLQGNSRGEHTVYNLLKWIIGSHWDFSFPFAFLICCLPVKQKITEEN